MNQADHIPSPEADDQWPCWKYKSKRTFIIKRAIKVVAASVKAGGQLDEVASPSVASPGETGESHQMLGSNGQEVAVHAALI